MNILWETKGLIKFDAGCAALSRIPPSALNPIGAMCEGVKTYFELC